MKISEFRKLIREEVKKTLKEEGTFTTSLTDEEKNSLVDVVKKIDELKAAILNAQKVNKNNTIKKMLEASPGLSEINTLRARMTTIYQLRDL